MIDICFKITHFLLLSNKLSRNSCGSHNCLIVSHSSVAPGVVLMSLGSKGFSWTYLCLSQQWVGLQRGGQTGSLGWSHSLTFCSFGAKALRMTGPNVSNHTVDSLGQIDIVDGRASRQSTQDFRGKRFELAQHCWGCILLAKANHRPALVQDLDKWILPLDESSCKVTLQREGVQEGVRNWGSFAICTLSYLVM